MNDIYVLAASGEDFSRFVLGFRGCFTARRLRTLEQLRGIENPVCYMTDRVRQRIPELCVELEKFLETRNLPGGAQVFY